MNRITQLDPAQATGSTKPLFDQVRAELGVVPNFFRVLGTSPAALRGYLSFNTALGDGILTTELRAKIALAVAEGNLCGYCLSAHTFLSKKLGFSDEEIADARRANAATTKADAVLKLSRDILVQRGEVRDPDLEQARACGLSNEEIVETVANVVLNIFSNYVNHVACTIIDFPEIRPGEFARP